MHVRIFGLSLEATEDLQLKSPEGAQYRHQTQTGKTHPPCGRQSPSSQKIFRVLRCSAASLPAHK